MASFALSPHTLPIFLSASLLDIHSKQLDSDMRQCYLCALTSQAAWGERVRGAATKVAEAPSCSHEHWSRQG